MANNWLWRLGAVAGAGALIVIGGLAWNTEPGLRMRAALGQKPAQMALVLRDYQAGDLSSAFARIDPLLLAEHEPAVALVCELLSQRPAYPPQTPACLEAGDQPQLRRLAQLSDLAVFARQWDVLAGLLDRREAAGDTRVAFERARAAALLRPEAPDMEDVVTHLRASAQATDPRGQYLLAVYQLGLAADGEASIPFERTLATLLTQEPAIAPADAYFELAKLMQAGAISSDLAYAEVLRRADQLGNPYAAGHLAQYLIANPGMAPVGGLEADGWMARAADNGDPVARYNLAVQLLAGEPDAAAISKAEGLLLASAETGFAPATTRLGALYWRRPQLVAEDADTGRRRAVDLWIRAADLGDANAFFNLGEVARAQGEIAQAREYYQQAAERGNAGAAEALGALE